MQVSGEQATLLSMLARLVGTRRAVEVGTFTGLSSLSFARAMPADGRLLCLDVSAEFTAVAREFWAKAGVADRIELRLGPAAESLAALPTEPHLDLAFIDADKGSYPRYWAELVPRMRPGGLIIVDNVLWKGMVLDPPADDPDAQALAAFNDEVVRDDRVDVVMLLFADGLTLARKRL
jgi:caffeoyl-CoA O-methyltransferase